jgi:hypothetical protein
MTLTDTDRSTLTKAFQDSIPELEQMIHIYCEAHGIPERFALSLFDADGAGGPGAADANPDDHAIVEHQIRRADWEERNFTQTARRKWRASYRTGRDTGDLVLNAKELFQEGDQQSPGCCLAEVDGKKVAVAGSGMRGLEDAAFALIMIEAMKRRTTPPA